jgi:F-type H+-transporting ATPase subunit delta
MTISTLSKRYAKAIFDLALEKNAIDEVQQDMVAIKNMLDESSKLREVVQNPVISRNEQLAAMSFLLKRIKVGEMTQRFVAVLINNGRLNVLGDAVESFFDKLKQYKGEIDAKVVSAIPLSSAHIVDIEKQLSGALGKKVKVQSEIDEEILGGLVITIGSKMLDASVSGKLEKLAILSKNAIAS